MRIPAAAARAIDDDLGGLVGQDPGREPVHLVVRQMPRAGQAPVAPVLLREGFDEHRPGVPGELAAQFFTIDLLQHGFLLEGWYHIVDSCKCNDMLPHASCKCNYLLP